MCGGEVCGRSMPVLICSLGASIHSAVDVHCTGVKMPSGLTKSATDGTFMPLR